MPMAHRASWRGSLEIEELSVPVALHAAASTSERVAFRIVNRATGNTVKRELVDEETGKPVPPESQVKGYETEPGQYVTLKPEEVAAAVPEGDHELVVERFVACDEIDEVYLDRPYYLVPGDRMALESYAVVRDGMRDCKVAALARAVLFRRVRTVLLRADGDGLIATTLNFDYEVREAGEVFADIAERAIDDEMLDLARHIIDTRRGTFDPSRFDDRFEAALVELIETKVAGKPLPHRAAAEPARVLDLREALRKSAREAGGTDRKRGGGLRRAG